MLKLLNIKIVIDEEAKTHLDKILEKMDLDIHEYTSKCLDELLKSKGKAPRKLHPDYTDEEIYPPNESSD